MRIQSKALAAFASLACLTFAASASADPETHDGFFLKLELGPGYLSMPGTAEAGSASVDTSIKGVGAIGGLLIGGTPADGLVVGGASLAHVVSSPTVEVDGRELDTNDSLTLSVLGPFVQYYPDPSAGLNLGLVLGYASASGGNDDVDEAATGFGVSASVGNDWWIGEEWSLGVAGRFTYANVKYESSSGGLTVTQKYNAMVPGAVLTLTYH